VALGRKQFSQPPIASVVGACHLCSRCGVTLRPWLLERNAEHRDATYLIPYEFEERPDVGA